METNELTSIIIGNAIEVHKALGPGLLEHPYKECLYYKLAKEGLFVQKEKPLPIVYEEVKLECGYRLDLVVEHSIPVEIKSVEALNDLHLAQVITYLKWVTTVLGYLSILMC